MTNQWILAIDLERTGPNEEADSKILIKDENLDSLVAQEKQVLDETKKCLGGELICACDQHLAKRIIHPVDQQMILFTF